MENDWPEFEIPDWGTDTQQSDSVEFKLKERTLTKAVDKKSDQSKKQSSQDQPKDKKRKMPTKQTQKNPTQDSEKSLIGDKVVEKSENIAHQKAKKTKKVPEVSDSKQEIPHSTVETEQSVEKDKKANPLKEKLDSARFRFLNETLYTISGDDAWKMFQEEPELFEEYHKGFSLQVAKWPMNPVDSMINFIKTVFTIATKIKLPKSSIIADFGCGEAKIAKTFPDRKIHSFDLVAANEYITACDISNVPLKDATVDVALFVLSLMGTNYLDFISEAYRVLKKGGILKIAEVTSRFENLSTFCSKVMSAMGFDVIKKDESNSHFVLLQFTKSSRACQKKAAVPFQKMLKPCLYKRR